MTVSRTGFQASRGVPDELGGQQCASVAGADGGGAQLLRTPGDVGDDLGPQGTLGAAADRDHAPDVAAGRLDDLDVVPDAETGGFERGR